MQYLNLFPSCIDTIHAYTYTFHTRKHRVRKAGSGFKVAFLWAGCYKVGSRFMQSVGIISSRYSVSRVNCSATKEIKGHTLEEGHHSYASFMFLRGNLMPHVKSFYGYLQFHQIIIQLRCITPEEVCFT